MDRAREGRAHQASRKHGKARFERIEKLWGENESPEARSETLAAATLDKHDAIIRRNLGMNETQGGTGAQLKRALRWTRGGSSKSLTSSRSVARRIAPFTAVAE